MHACHAMRHLTIKGNGITVAVQPATSTSCYLAASNCQAVSEFECNAITLDV